MTVFLLSIRLILITPFSFLISIYVFRPLLYT